MKQRWYINRISFRILFPAFAGIVLYLAMLTVFGNLESLSETFFSQEALFLVILSYINHEWAIFLLGRKKSQSALESRRVISKIIYFLILFSGTGILSSGVILIYFVIIIGYLHFATEMVTILILMSLMQLMVHMYYLSILNIRRYHQLSIEKEEIQGRQLELELESFKTEMNPGLLMECLENLLTLMQKDIGEADNFIQALSNQYRYLLESRNKEFVNLNEEIGIVEELVFLLNGGGESKISINHKSADGELPVVPGTLHSILYSVENSMILSPLNPLQVKIGQQKSGDILLSHSNRPRLEPGARIRLDKLNKSYKYYTNRKIIREEKDSEVHWIIPHLPEILE